MTTTTVAPPVESTVTEIELSTDKPECAHFVDVPEGEPDKSPHAYVMRARIEGFPVTALCGYTWVPNKKATGLPVCAECKAILDLVDFVAGREGSVPSE